MADVMNPSHSIFNKPGDEGSPGSKIEARSEERGNDPIQGIHGHIHKPGDEGSSKLGVNDGDYMQGYLCTEADITAPGYVGPGGPEVRKTYIPPAQGSNPTPEMPGAN